MIIKQNLHTHTTYCDGNDKPEEMIRTAIDKGFDAIGFSGHGYTAFDYTYCMMDMDAYVAEIRRVAEKYKKDIEVYAGVEEDASYPLPRDKFDYILGSSHYFYVDHVYYPVDSNWGCMENALRCMAMTHFVWRRITILSSAPTSTPTVPISSDTLTCSPSSTNRHHSSFRTPNIKKSPRVTR